MKFKSLVIISLGLVMILASCSDQKDRYEKLSAEYKALEQQIAEKDRIVSELLTTLAAIEKNLSLLREKEELIDVASINRDEISPDVQLRALQEINAVAGVLKENYSRLASLKEELWRSGTQITAFRQTVKTLNEAILAKEDHIDTLKARLIEINYEMDELDYLITSMQEIDSIKQGIIESQKQTMNTAWMAVGNEKDLIEKGIIVKTGGILGIGSTCRFTGDVSDEHFNKVDISTFGSVAFRGKKPKLITIHPDESYQLSENDLNNQLSIADPDEFWSTSRYMVLVTK
jgi:hypothetical protein